MDYNILLLNGTPPKDYIFETPPWVKPWVLCRFRIFIPKFSDLISKTQFMWYTVFVYIDKHIHKYNGLNHIMIGNNKVNHCQSYIPEFTLVNYFLWTSFPCIIFLNSSYLLGTRKGVSKLERPLEAYNVLRLFLLLWKRLELIKRHWGKQKLNVDHLNTVSTYQTYW